MTDNPQLALARDFLEHTSENIFLTGRAGTGKTTFLRHLRESSPKRMIVVAPTGVAAINAGGVTMHSFFQLPFGVYIPGMMRRQEEVRRFSKTKIAIIKSLDLLVIDEISMVRADLLDSVDDVLRRFRDHNKPFGGVQLLMIGDLQQLAPVVKEDEWALLKDYYASPYFFDSAALKKTSYMSVELRHIYRQTDAHFIELLSRVRDNAIDAEVLGSLNARCDPSFNPAEEEGYIVLTSHNHTARATNDRKLEALTTPCHSFEAEIEGEFPDYLYPVEGTLMLKEGAQVMFTKNDPSPEKRFVNGTIGIVTHLREDYIEVLPAGADEPIAVEKAQWANSKYTLDAQTSQIVEKVEGVFTQYPLKTAWAITIHKSQGLTFDRVIIDAADSFSHGQVYVALSRCRTLEGIVLRTPLGRGAIISDRTVGYFTRGVEENQPTQRQLEERKQQYYEALLAEQFDFGPLFSRHAGVGRFMEEHLWRLYPKFIESWKEANAAIRSDLLEVGLRFRLQINRLMGEDYVSDPVLAERVVKGAAWFAERCSGMVASLYEASKLNIDNKDQKKSFTDLLSRLNYELRVKLSTLAVCQSSFSVKEYLEARATAVASLESSPKVKFATSKGEKPAKASKEGEAAKQDAVEDILNPELFELLRAWRTGQAGEQGVPAYVIASTKALIGIANMLPASSKELQSVKGIGKVFTEKFGSEVLAIVKDYRDGRI